LGLVLSRNPLIAEKPNIFGISMSKSVAILLALVLTASSVTAFLPVKAEARMIVVPDNYPTITAAIGNATDGDTVFVKKGTYEEHKLMINKTLSLMGEDANFTVIKNLRGPLISEPGFVPPLYEVTAIQINANNVWVSGFTIMNSGEPIVGNGNGTRIIGNIILRHGEGITLEGNNNTIINNILSGIGDVFIACFGSYNTIAGNSMTGDGSDNDIKILGSFNVVYNNTLTDSGSGIGVYGEANTIAKNNITNSGSILIYRDSRNNIICANRVNGVAVFLMGFNNTFYANEIVGVGIGGFHGGSIDAANNVFYHNNFLGNAPELRVSTKAPGPLIWDNGKEGNYWSSYHGSDANGDGIGDVPYKVTAAYSYYDGAIREETIVDCGQDNFPLMSPFDISTVTIQLPEWASPPSNPSPQKSETEPEPFSAMWVATALAIAAVTGVASLAAYYVRRKRATKTIQ